jgi:hypothetical protein
VEVSIIFNFWAAEDREVPFLTVSAVRTRPNPHPGPVCRCQGAVIRPKRPLYSPVPPPIHRKFLEIRLSSSLEAKRPDEIGFQRTDRNLESWDLEQSRRKLSGTNKHDTRDQEDQG